MRVLDLLLGAVQALELRLLLERIVERDAELERNQLGDAVDVAVAHAEHAPAIAHHGLRRHGAEGGDLRDAFGAVLALHIVDDAVAAVLAEVDVEVGHRDALGIEEALEQQLVAQRIESGDAERVCDQRACARAAARTDRHAVRLRPVDEIRDDQEVAGEAHLDDDVLSSNSRRSA